MLNGTGERSCIFPFPKELLPLVKVDFHHPSPFDFVQVSIALCTDRLKESLQFEVLGLVTFAEMVLNILHERIRFRLLQKHGISYCHV
jgi:hypothetical protein